MSLWMRLRNTFRTDRLQREIAPRRCHIEQMAHPNLIVQVGAGNPVHLQLDAHPVVVRTGQIGKRIVAQQNWTAGFRLYAQDNKLTGQSGNEWTIVSRR